MGYLYPQTREKENRKMLGTELCKTRTRYSGQLPSRLSNRQRKFVDRNLAVIGYSSYREYMNSPEWAETRNRYRASNRLQSCLVCRAPNVDLHHRTYKRLGRERLHDLVPLCREHHEQLHEQGLDLWVGPTLLYQEQRRVRRASQSMTSHGRRSDGTTLAPLV